MLSDNKENENITRNLFCNPVLGSFQHQHNVNPWVFLLGKSAT